MNPEINARKIAIVGCGMVGATSAFALMEQGLFSELVLVDVNRERAEGEAMDIGHGMIFASPMNETMMISWMPPSLSLRRAPARRWAKRALIW